MRAEKIAELTDLYGGAVYGFCRRLAGAEADDLYQQTFLKALELHDEIDDTRNPKGFLIALSVRLWQNRCSKLSRRSKIAPITDGDDGCAEISSGGILTEDEVQQRVLHENVRQLVGALPSKLKAPVLMYYNAEMTVEEIAGSLKLPPGTVKSRLHRARQVLKAGLGAWEND